MFKKSITSGAIALSLLCSSVLAADFELDIKPGLWEHSFSMESESGAMESAIEEALRQLQSLPESQRRMVENMMREQGINLDLAGSTMQICITEEDIQRGSLPQQENCEQSIEQQTDDTLYFDFECAGDPPYSGQGSMTLVNREHYTGSAEFSTEMAGRQEHIQMTQEGYWLQDDCDG
ncbi:DUF3617 domain-containing protein [Aliidiomarina minuta]|uniref:DUF3617 domain-containing protein n=1 Tax=Aliidiomarina minuta TaxID=880057 RepID=A0A432WBQ7_9GAMM|nr:DUF3617 domain-containing protein [Aliidiomarina minuta]RUO27028.1 DUF3617 domain-containing protein [Aliidiomarina minuta]